MCSKAGKQDRTDQNIKQKNSDYGLRMALGYTKLEARKPSGM